MLSKLLEKSAEESWSILSRRVKTKVKNAIEGGPGPHLEHRGSASVETFPSIPPCYDVWCLKLNGLTLRLDQ